MKISLIIPAFNSAHSLPETLQSVLNQTFSGWEALIVDDGSTDDTAAVAAAWVHKDARFRLIRQANSGVSVARNAGIRAARGEWLCFLDADDLLDFQHLEKLLQRGEADPGLTGVYCGWARFREPGVQTSEKCHFQEGDLFHLLGRTSLFAIHSCLIRRSAVESAGGFDPDFTTCEDWDLWQRISRTGARFACVRETLALYRMSGGSLSCDVERMLEDGLRVIDKGCSADPRVVSPALEHADGLSRKTLAATCFYYLSWCAGLVCGGGGDAVPLLDTLKTGEEPALDAEAVAQSMFRTVPLGKQLTTEAWPEMPESVLHSVRSFLQALEQHSGSSNLARRAYASLERLIASLPGDFMTGKTLSRPLEVTAPLHDLQMPPGCERVCLKVFLEGDALGMVHLPVFAGLLPAEVVRDSITSQFCWRILTRFFERTLYPLLRFECHQGTVTAWRGEVLLAANLREDEGMKAVHDAADWTLFLQELWGLPEWSQTRFYDALTEIPEAPVVSAALNSRVVVHAGEPVPSLHGAAAGTVRIDFKVAGISLGVVDVSVEDGKISAEGLQASLTAAAGFELCCAVVREALTGEDWSEVETLRERLLIKRLERQEALGVEGAVDERAAVIPRRRAEIFGDSASRRAVMPPDTLNDLSAAAAACGEPAMIPSAAGPPDRILYLPELLPQESPCSCRAPSGDSAGGQPEIFEYNRAHFESLFARSKDPWLYTSEYEKIKYGQTLALLPEGEIQDALELACAEGHFTCQLAPRVRRLTAMDISALALQEAQRRCGAFSGIHYVQMDLLKDGIPGSYDLIVCSEVLYYTGNEQNLAAIGRRIAKALKPGGLLVMAHAHLVVDDPDKPGFNWNLPFGARRIGEIVSQAGKLSAVREIRTPFYRVQSFRRPSGRMQGIWSARRAPTVEILSEQPAPLPQAVAAQALWKGGKPVQSGSAAGTLKLPVLMYHRVSAEGVEKTRRWRVTPEQFTEHLRYLADSGCYTPHPDDWWRAASQRKPLPGRAVILTFDDGHLDFYSHARPLLKKYNFRALIFAVSKAVGLTNRWDIHLGEETPLMNWDHLRELQEEGFIIGSHTATHPALTALSPLEAAGELASARAELSQRLGADIGAVAYPYGDADALVAHLAGAAGYRFGFTCQERRAVYSDNFLMLPRIEVRGDRSFPEFVHSLECL